MPAEQEENMPTDLERHSTHDAEAPNGQPAFVGNLAMVLLVLAVLFALLVIFGALTHPAA
jgi:hypothetical protein